MMSYVDLNWDFSQFDRDNTDRFQAAAYINNANALAKRILNSPKAGQANSELQAADRYYGEAKAALATHDYAATFYNAKRAYEAVLDGARGRSEGRGEQQRPDRGPSIPTVQQPDTG
jgi:hypothetical protein